MTNKTLKKLGFTTIEAVFGLLIFLIFGVGSLEMIKFTAGNSMIARVQGLRDGLFAQLNQDLKIPAYLSATMNDAANGSLVQCVTGKTNGALLEDGCNANTNYPLSFITSNRVSTGTGELYSMSGGKCQGDQTKCPIMAVTTFSAFCEGGKATCTRAQKIILNLSVQINPQFKQVMVNPTSEQTVLDIGAFSGGPCPSGRISRGYLPNGLPDCWVWQIGSAKPSTSGANYRDDEGLSITVDPSGNTYFGGITYGSFGNHTSGGSGEIFVGMIDGFGNTKWVNQFSTGASAGLGSIAFNLADNSIYITGKGSMSGSKAKGKSSKSDAFVMKLNTSGETLWSYSLGSQMGSMGKSIAFDNNGNSITAFIAGENKAGNMAWGLSDFYISKTDSEGNEVWTTSVGTKKDSSRMVRVVTDLNDNTFILGSSGEANNYTQTDTYVGKLSSTGDILSQVTYNYTNNEEAPQDMVVNTTTNEIVVGGQTRTDSSSPWSVYLLKFDAANLAAAPTVKTIAFSGNNLLQKMSIDSNGNTYIAVNTDGALTGFTNAGQQDVYIAKLDSNLDVVWSRQLGTGGTESIADIVTRTIAGQAYTFIIGSTTNSFAGWLNEAPSRDIFFAKFESNGR